MNDRELLELAAKAVGKDGYEFVEPWGCMALRTDSGRFTSAKTWNPLEDDGDALRLAVQLGLDVEMHGCNETHPYACAFHCEFNLSIEEQPEDGDPYAATRRAIVRAAAELGKEING